MEAIPDTDDPNNNASTNTHETASSNEASKGESDSLEQMLRDAIGRFDAPLIKDLVVRGVQLNTLWLEARKYRNVLHELVLVYGAVPALERPPQLHLKFIEIVTVFVQNGLDVNDVDINRQTALHMLAGIPGQADAIKVLLANGVKVNAMDRSLQTPLHLAVMRAGRKEVEALLDGGADPNIFNSMGASPLHLAAKRKRNSHMLEILLRAGAVVNLQHSVEHNVIGSTPLHLACKAGCIHNVTTLLQHSANPDLLDSSGQTCLHVAAAKDMSGEITQKLIFAGAYVNAKDATFQETPLHKAIKYHMFDNIRVLLATRGIGVNIGDSQKETPLHKAATLTSDVHALILLMKARSDPKVQNIFGQSPMSKAIRAKNVNALSVMRQYEDAITEVAKQPSPYSIRRLPTIMTPMM